MSRFLIVLLGLAFFLLVAPQALADEVTSTNNDLKAEIAALRAEVNQLRPLRGEVEQLRTSSDRQWLNERRAEEVKALVRQVLADADTRASLLDNGLTAGHNGKNFFLASEDGNFMLRIAGQLQVRYVYNTRDDSGNDDYRGGFEVARTRFSFSGHVVDPTWKYMILTGHHSNGTDFLLDAFITKELGNGLSVTAGQFKVPLWHEWLVSETRTQFVERSDLNTVYAGNYTQGLLLSYQKEKYRLYFSFNDGVDTRNTAWDNNAAATDTDWALTGRGEWLVFGKWDQYSDFEAWAGEDPMLVIGGGLHYQQGEYGTPNDEAAQCRWTIDAALEVHQFSFYAAGLGNHITGQDDKRDQYGLLVQGGFMIAPKVELVARYEWGDLDSGDDDRLSVATVGVNYFIRGHQIKWTTDVSYALDPIRGGWANSFNGYLVDAPGEDGQIVFRTQLQLLF